MITRRDGVTITELLVASTIAAVIALGLSTIEGNRAQMQQALRRQAGLTSSKDEVAQAVLFLTRAMGQADRINIVNPSTLQVRSFRPTIDTLVPPCTCTTGSIDSCCFNIAGNYVWEQFSHDLPTKQLRWYRGTTTGCTDMIRLADQMTAMTIQYQSPGLDMLQYDVLWDDENGESRAFRGSVYSQAVSYASESFEMVAAGDSGLGSDWTGVSPPPAVCP